MARRHIIGKQVIMGQDRLLVGQGSSAVDEILAIAGLDSDDLTPGQKAAIETRVLSNSSLVVKDEPPQHARRFPLGFESAGPIAVGASVTITSRPQVLFKGQRLSVPSDIAGSFVVDDLKVGKDSQFVAEGSIPARCLQENAISNDFELDTAQISQDVSISVTNIGGAPVTFRAALWGQVAE